MKKNYKVGDFELDQNQMEIINNNSNMLVIAGAGSGKTLTIVGKINYLLENNCCTPNEVLVISFTNASVNDIKRKLKYCINVFTFHKLSIEILKSVNIPYKICDEKLLKYIVEEYLKSCSIEEQKNILKFLKLNIKYEHFMKSANFTSFCKLIISFINLFKTNQFNFKHINELKYSKIEQKILIIIFKILYQYYLEKQSMQIYDFDDLIINATKIANKTKFDYKYIIIDEFQDTSLVRLNLIKEIYQNSNAKIIVVGDDWQSIYRFSGCDLNIFLNFQNIFPDVKKIMLKNTYRNSLDLIKVASTFIQKNPVQIKKQLYSSKSAFEPIIFVPYTNKKHKFKRLINYLLKFSKDIMILSRNNNDIFEYLDQEFCLENNNLIYKNCTLKFYTIHRAKGLEAEYVVLINCNNEFLGIPNKIENSSLIEKLITNNEIKYAEERRLFYVAITRCKEKTYLLYNLTSPSIFVKEIIKIMKKQLLKINFFK